MLFNTLLLLLGVSASNALPFNGAQAPRKLAQRAKTYAVVNVDGASTTLSPETTTVLQPTTVTPKVTSSTSTPTSAPAAKQPATEPSPEPSPEPTPEPKPVFVTVITTETASPTEFYDNGMWHTSYPVKTFEELAAPTAASSSMDQAYGRR